MLSCVINQASKLKDANLKQSFFIAKELAIIEVNLIWYPENLDTHAARLKSLAQHVTITFPGNEEAKTLSALLKQKALSLHIQAQ